MLKTHLFLACAMTWALAFPVGAQQYQVFRIGDFGGASSNAFGVNNWGDAVGGTVGIGYLYSQGVSTNLGNLGTPFSTTAFGVNDQSVAVGVSSNISGAMRGFIFENGVIQALSGSFNSSVAYAINNSGQIAGMADGQAVRWSGGPGGGLPISLGSLGGVNSQAYGINNLGHVVGYSETSGLGGPQSAFVWQNGQMINLGRLGGNSSTAYAINDLGLVVGQSDLAGIPGNHAVMWDENFNIIDLGTLGGQSSTARGVNNRGEIVGSAETLLPGGSRAFIYDDGVMRDLNLFLNEFDRTQWFLGNAYDINDSGWIVGSGFFQGQLSSFLLVPQGIPEPSTYAICLASMLFLRRTRRD